MSDAATRRGRRPGFEIWFAVLLDERRRRALWIRETLFVPRRGGARATVWGAWFDADARPAARSAKAIRPLAEARLGEGGDLIRIGDSRFGPGGAAGRIEGLAWDVRWSGGARRRGGLPAWLPAPTHARSLVHDAEAEGTVTVGGERLTLRGRATAMHLWGTRRVPRLRWIWAPWLGGDSLEVTAASVSGRRALGVSELQLGARRSRATTEAGDHGLVVAEARSARRLVRARAWAEPEHLVGYAYRDTDGRDLLVAQSDTGSAHLEVYSRLGPGAPWRPAEERRSAGGVAVEIHQRAALPGVDYLGWDQEARAPRPAAEAPAQPGSVPWPEVRAIVALGLTYRDHLRETGQRHDPGAPPVTFEKHRRTFVAGDAQVVVPDSPALLAALDAVEPGLGARLHSRLGHLPAVMDYEGELALVALDAIDEEALAAGAPQPLGLAAVNDLTARVCQALGEGTARPYDFWACSKSFARFLPAAPRVWAPAGGLRAIPELTIETRVNGRVRQRASTRELLYNLPAIVRAARAQLGRPLGRGDVIATGTPAGVGLRMGPLKRRAAALVKDRFRKVELLVAGYATSSELLRPGDLVEVDAGPAGRVRVRLTV